MKRLLKWVIGIVVALVILVVLALVIVTHFINPNQFKPQIQKAISQATHRKVAIQGDLQWELFPNVGLKIGSTTLNNPQGFEQKTPFLHFTSAQASVALMPLLSGHVSINKLSLTGLQVNLIEKDPKTNNWTFSTRPAAHKKTETKQKTTQSGHGKPLNLSIKTLYIKNANISFTNTQKKQHFAVHDFNFTAHNINFNQPFPIQLDFKANGNQPKFTNQTQMTATLQANLGQSLFEFKDLNLTNQYTQTRPGKKPLIANVHFQGSAHVDLKQGLANWHSQVTVNKMLHVNTVFSVKELLATPQLSGTLVTQPFDLGKLLTSLGEPKMNLPNPKALSDTNLDIAVSGTPKLLHFTKINGHLYHSQLDGNATITQQDQATHIESQFVLDQIDLSNYIGLGGAQLPVNRVTLNTNLSMHKGPFNPAAKALNGTVNANITDLTLKGLDLPKIFGQFTDALNDFIKQMAKKGIKNVDWDKVKSLMPVIPNHINPNNGQTTTFGKMVINSSIKNGLVTLSKADLIGPTIMLRNHGTIDLSQKTVPVDIHLKANGFHQTTVNGEPVSQENTIGLAYVYKGPLNHAKLATDWPVVQKEINAYIGQAIQQAVQKGIQNAFKKGLEDLFHKH